MKHAMVVVAAVFMTVTMSCGTAERGVSVNFDDSVHAFTDAERKVIANIADSTFDEVRALLPALAKSVTLDVASGTQVIPETGELGAATAPGRIAWIVDAGRPGGVEAIAKMWLRATLFHEMHHVARGYVMNGGAPPRSFMDGVVSEGLATAFQRDAAGADVPWATYPDEVELWVDELRSLPLHAPYPDWMFQHPDGRRWIGYRAGTYIADRAIAASGRSAADLVGTPAAEILALAGVDVTKRL